MVAIVSLGVCPVYGQELVIAEGGQSSYHIVIPEKASEPVRHAADELAKFMREMTGANLSIRTDAFQPVADHEILLGNNRRLQELGIQIDWQKLGKEGYTIKTVGQRLIIAGGEPRG
ncbi:MAG: hypothetical protein H5T71_10575, partial [Chloroflexi bacterium]|nr:hypothetical protein [Chloroflexota bacterium]